MAELDLGFLEDGLILDNLPAPYFKFGRTTYGHPARNIANTVLTTVRAYAISWSPSVRFKDASSDDLAQIKNLDEKYHQRPSRLSIGKFDAINVGDRAIIQFTIVSRLAEKVLPADTVFGKDFANRHYWLRVEKRPINKYTEVHKILARNFDIYIANTRL